MKSTHDKALSALEHALLFDEIEETDEKSKRDFVKAYELGAKESPRLPLFVHERDKIFDEFTLNLDAGYVNKDGVICSSQFGIEETFSIGMPMYDYKGNMLGYLSIGLFGNLMYHDGTPASYWKIEGYSGEITGVMTYHQFFRKLQTNQ